MKKIIALLSVVLFSFGVAKAGELTVTGSAKASYAITSSDGTAGASNATPLVHFDLAKAHLQIPTIETADIISTTIEFAGQGDTISSTDELVVNYKGSTTHSESGYLKADSLAV